jgi:hypothetical protein
MLRRIRKAGQKCPLNQPLYCPKNGEPLTGRGINYLRKGKATFDSTIKYFNNIKAISHCPIDKNRGVIQFIIHNDIEAFLLCLFLAKHQKKI